MTSESHAKPDRIWVLPIVAGICVAVLAGAFFHLAHLGGGPIQVELRGLEDAQVQMREAVARWIWAIAQFTLVTVALVVFTASLFLMTRKGLDNRQPDLVFGGSLVAGLGLSLAWAFREQPAPGEHPVYVFDWWKTLFDHAFDTTAIKSAHWLLNFGNALGVFTTVAIILGIAVALRSGAVALRSGRPGDKNALALSMKRLWTYLYMGGSFLVCSVIEIHAFHRWPAALVWDEADRELIDSLAATVSGAFGVGYTLLLAGAVVPGFLLLRRRAKALAYQEVDGEADQVEAWLSKNGFEIEWLPGLVRVVALLGPALAGLPFGELIRLGGA